MCRATGADPPRPARGRGRHARLRAVRPRRSSRLAQAANQLLGLADRQLLVDDRCRRREPGSSAGRPPRARAWPSVIRPSATASWTVGCELEQAERVRDGRPRAPDARRELLLGEAELVDQLAEGARRLDRVEILALEVLDEGELELLRDRRAGGRSPGSARGRPAGRAHPALAGDELVAVERLGHEDRLDARRAGGCSRRGRERLVVHPLAWLVRVLADARRAGSRSTPVDVGDRCGMSAARPRPRPCGRSLRTVMRAPPRRRRRRRVERGGGSRRTLVAGTDLVGEVAVRLGAPRAGGVRGIGRPWLGASDRRTLRGMTVSKTRRRGGGGPRRRPRRSDASGRRTSSARRP